MVYTLHIKPYSQLTTDELFEILSARSTVFVVEQHCAYQDMDTADKLAIHVWLTDENGLQAYCRVLPKEATGAEVAIGRVITLKRRCGLGTRIVEEGLKVAQDAFQAKKIVIHAQEYVRSLYEKVGFVQTSDTFLEDGIPHIEMTWKAPVD